MEERVRRSEAERGREPAATPEVALLDSLHSAGPTANDGDSDLCLRDLVSEVSEVNCPLQENN